MQTEQSEGILDQTLPNGVRVVAEHMPWVSSTAVGIYLPAGSAHEPPARRGMGHFIEHMLFKGTSRRSAVGIAQEIDSVGGALNAFTEHEYTCLYAQVVTDHAETAVDILGDMLTAPLFDADEFEREKDVIIEEIRKAEDTPDDRVHDLFAETIWPGHPLGRAIMGTEEAIRGVSRDAAIEYYRTNYGPQGVICAFAGSLPPQEALEMAERHFGALAGGAPTPIPGAVEPHIGEVYLERPTEQVHFCIGGHGLALTDDDWWALALVDSALGGGMSSRLFQEIREKRGLVYNIGSYLNGYREAGLLVASGGTSPERWPLVCDLVRAETEQLCANGITADELARAHQQVKGGMAIALESTGYRARRIGTSVLYFNRVMSVAETLARFDAVTVESAHAAACRVLDGKPLHLAAVGPQRS